MKLCTIWGDLFSDKTSEQYLQENVCEVCIEEDLDTENSRIVTINGEYDSSYGDVCFFCEKTFEEEQEELGE